MWNQQNLIVTFNGSNITFNPMPRYNFHMDFKQAFTFLIVLTLSVTTKAQSYSTYYGTYDVNLNSNSNVNINKQVDVSGDVNVNKTVTSIDYGALAQANALQEQNRLAAMQFANEQERIALTQIAEDPSKAFNFGYDNKWLVPKDVRRNFGWNKKLKYFYHKIPHKSLFTASGGYNYENLSVDGVKTQIIVALPIEVDKLKSINPTLTADIESRMKYPDFAVGELNPLGVDGSEAFLHAVDTKKARVGGLDGFRGTLIWEDDYEKALTDNYASIGYKDGKTYQYTFKVRYKGDKDVVTFEQLEGRRFYFRGLIDKMVSTISLSTN